MKHITNSLFPIIVGIISLILFCWADSTATKVSEAAIAVYAFYLAISRIVKSIKENSEEKQATI